MSGARKWTYNGEGIVVDSEGDVCSGIRNAQDGNLIAEAPKLMDTLDAIVKEAIEHWPDAENWESIINAQSLIEKVRGNHV